MYVEREREVERERRRQHVGGMVSDSWQRAGVVTVTRNESTYYYCRPRCDLQDAGETWWPPLCVFKPSFDCQSGRHKHKHKHNSTCLALCCCCCCSCCFLCFLLNNWCAVCAPVAVVRRTYKLYFNKKTNEKFNGAIKHKRTLKST